MIRRVILGSLAVLTVLVAVAFVRTSRSPSRSSYPLGISIRAVKLTMAGYYHEVGVVMRH